ncbi:MAG: hypothetical protein JXR90_09185, partial [Spirochaetes bacterium]|nr:hypothetical protein [Spirochaetota bacterium]
NDKVLWKYEKTSEDFYNIDEEGNTKKVPQSTLDKALRSLFETGVKEATPSFKQYKIDMNIQKFKNLPDTINGSEYSAEIKILKYINHGEDELTEARKYGEIWLYSSKHGKKKLTDFVFEGVRAREVKGGRYTKSPYEKRILINFYGYGSFMDGFYIDERFTGADLTTRFKKD